MKAGSHQLPAPVQRDARLGFKFPRTAKLLKHGDFQRVYKNGKRHFAKHMTVFFLLRADDAGPCVGFTVGRVLGGAVERNRIKRRMREAVRLHLAELRVSVDVVINPKKSAMDTAIGDLEREISRAFEVIAKQSANAGSQAAQGNA